MTRPRPLIGAHCGGGIRAALDRAELIGAECLQIFASAPQMWRAPNHKPADVQAFVDGRRAAGLGPVFLHAIYLLNLASPNPENVAKSVQSIKDHLAWADRLGAEGLVVHVGSAGKEEYAVAEDRVVAALGGLLGEIDGQASLLLETCAGQGATIGRSFAELGRIIRRLDGHPRLGVCLDTCHVFAAGYKIHEGEGIERMLEELEGEVGLNRLRCVHANDSKGAFASNVDRHENIGLGRLGEVPFARRRRGGSPSNNLGAVMRFLVLFATVALLAACSANPPPPTAKPGATQSQSATSGGKPVAKTYSSAPAMSIDPAKSYVAAIKTNLGEMKANLFAKDSPQTVNNFVFLAREGFYNGVKFHRVIKGFMVQTGDPAGTGGGGPGYSFKDELDLAKKNGYKKGMIAMANRGPNTNGSQFFIMDADYPLPPNYSLFGQVTDGVDVVNKIASVPTLPGGENSSPATDVRIESVTIDEK
jgi:apurinic endonuclease APN1